MIFRWSNRSYSRWCYYGRYNASSYYWRIVRYTRVCKTNKMHRLPFLDFMHVGKSKTWQCQSFNTSWSILGQPGLVLLLFGSISLARSLFLIGNGNTGNLKPGKASSFPQYWVFTFIDVYFIYVVSGPLAALIIGLILALGFFTSRCLCTLLDKKE